MALADNAKSDNIKHEFVDEVFDKVDLITGLKIEKPGKLVAAGVKFENDTFDIEKYIDERMSTRGSEFSTYSESKDEKSDMQEISTNYNDPEEYFELEEDCKSEIKTDETLEKSVLDDQDARKVFVGGLPASADAKVLREIFTVFGSVEDVDLKLDNSRNRNIGFGFITYENEKSVENVMNFQSKNVLSILSKQVNCKRVVAKPGKLYVKLPKLVISDLQVKHFFKRYGEIIQFERPIDKKTHEAKSFCFLTFKQEAIAKNLIKTGSIFIDLGKQMYELEIKKVK